MPPPQPLQNQVMRMAQIRKFFFWDEGVDWLVGISDCSVISALFLTNSKLVKLLCVFVRIFPLIIHEITITRSGFSILKCNQNDGSWVCIAGSLQRSPDHLLYLGRERDEGTEDGVGWEEMEVRGGGRIGRVYWKESHFLPLLPSFGYATLLRCQLR